MGRLLLCSGDERCPIPFAEGERGACKYNHVCGGCRIRTEKVAGDLWQGDPACYLADEEVGVASA